MLWRHNRVCIAWYKHGNWPITACVRQNLFYIIQQSLRHKHLPRRDQKIHNNNNHSTFHYLVGRLPIASSDW